MHRLRRVLQRLRRGRVEPGVSRPGSAQPRLDARERRARRSASCKAARGGGRCRLPELPHAHELQRALPERPLADRGHRRPEARDAVGRAAGGAVKSQTWLWAAQRASAAVLALCVAVHLATIVYAVQGGLTGAEILARTRGNAAEGQT